VSEPVKIVREPDLPRIAAATRAVLAEMTRPPAIRPADRRVPGATLRRRAISADDDHGREHGLVAQADGLRWDELDALAELTAQELDVAGHSGPGTWHPRCPTCTAFGGHRRITAHARYRTVGSGG
jgi:hypothetical protein